MDSKEFREGVEHRNLGKSIYYNPYRHKGTTQQYIDWVTGWTNANKAPDYG